MTLPSVTVVDVWNLAFMQLGLTTVSEMSDTRSHATKAGVAWPLFRQQFIQQHTWNGCKRTVTLTVDATAPTARWSYRYDLNAISGFLQLVRLNGNEVTPSDDWWEIETDSSNSTRWLLTDEATAVVEVIVDVTVEADLGKHLGPAACTAMGYAFAAYLSVALGKSPQEQQILENRASEKVKMAKAIDSQEGTPRRFGDTDLVTVRY